MSEPQENQMLPPAPPPPSAPSSTWNWFYAGPVILDALALVCSTVLAWHGILPVDTYKWLVGVLVVGNVALRFPGSRSLPPGGGGLIFAAGQAIYTFAKFKG